MRRAALCLALIGIVSVMIAAEQSRPRIANPEALAIEMAKALVAGDLARFTALAASREEMETMLETAQLSTRPDERQYVKDKVAEMVTDRAVDFARFQAMKKEAGVRDGVAVRFEVIELDRIYEKDGMKKVRHSHIRMFQATEGGREESFLIKLDDMFLFPRGWAFTSVWPAIGKETSRR